jgi:hypothetical protein
MFDLGIWPLPEIALYFRHWTSYCVDDVLCRLLDRDQVTAEEEKADDEEDDDLLKAFKVHAFHAFTLDII